MANKVRYKNNLRIEIDRELCIGAASCVMIAPNTFTLDEGGKVDFVDGELDDEQTIRAAADSCPVRAIILTEEELPPNKVDVEYRPHSSQIAQGNHSKEESDNSGDEEAIKAALKNVLDPELGINVVDLGLIYGIHQSSGAVTIDLTLTTPGCPMINEFCASVKQAVQQLPGINDVQVNLTFDPPWNPSKMSPEAADELGLFI